MRPSHLVAAAALLSMLAAGDGRAANSLSVLQFGTFNQSLSVQSGASLSNTATTLQFGVSNVAVSHQTGSLSTVNTLAIGQGGTTLGSTNSATSGQIGGSNGSLIGQIGGTNSANTFQAGLLNGSTVLQSSP